MTMSKMMIFRLSWPVLLYALANTVAGENNTCTLTEGNCVIQQGTLTTTVVAEPDYVDDDNDHIDNHDNDEDETCGIWLAMSTIPNSGIGIFAGKDFKKGDILDDSGDIVIPLVHHKKYKPDGALFLVGEYTWSAYSQEMDHEVKGKASVVSPGLGAAVNCVLDFLNVKEGLAKNILDEYNIPMHRAKNVSAGAFTYYQQRRTKAKTEIKAGHELFANYGERWFITRPEIGPIPLFGDHDKAGELVKIYLDLATKLDRKQNTQTHVAKDIWDMFVANNPWSDTSRLLFALPKEQKEVQSIRDDYNSSLKDWKRDQFARDPENVRKYGTCADHLKHGQSTIPEAGFGAFAKRLLKKGSIVAPVPLVHMPYKEVLDMGKKDGYDDKQHQLLLNYVYGHENSTMVFLPYSPVVSLINHNQTLANVRLQWADPQRSNHHPELLTKTVRHIEDHIHSSQLAMEFIALRDIHHGEEIFMDYGDAWEGAWQSHVSNWEPPTQDEDIEYKSASVFNKKYKNNPSLILPTNKVESTLPSNIQIKFNQAFEGDYWKDVSDLVQYRNYAGKDYLPAVILGHEYDKEYDGILYSAEVDFHSGETKYLSKLPREAFVFFDQPYTSDLHLPKAFRHEIQIPDDMFPDSWKNLLTDDNKYEKNKK